MKHSEFRTKPGGDPQAKVIPELKNFKNNVDTILEGVVGMIKVNRNT